MDAEIRTVEELRAALEKEIKSLKKDLSADVVTLHLYDPHRERLYFPVGEGLLQRERFMGGMPSMERVGGKIVRSAEPIIAEDAEHHPDVTGPFTYAEKTKSAAGFPLITDPESEDVLGILFVDYRQPHTFEEDEVEEIEERAAEIAHLLQQSFEGEPGRELEDALRRRDDLRLEEHRLRGIVHRLWGILGDVDVALWTRERGSRKLRINAYEGLDRDFVEHVSVDLSEDGAHFVAMAYAGDEEGVVLSDPDSDPGFFFDADLPVIWERILAVPVSTEHHHLGVLCVCRRERINFTRRERDLVKSFADLMAVTIENEERIVALNALHDVGVRLTLATELDDILQQVVGSACRVIGADTATVHLYDPVEQEFYDLDRAAVFPPEAKADMEKPRSAGGLSARIIEEGRVYFENVEQQREEGVLSTFIQEQGIQAYVGTRLTSIDEHLGVLYVSFREERRFPPQDLALIQVLANYASTAIYRTQLHEQSATVAEIAREITSVRDPDELLQETLERSLELLNCEYGSISVFDPDTEKLYFTYAVGKEPEMNVGLGEGLIGTAAQERRPVRVGDVSKDPRYVSHVSDTQSELDVPMLIGDRLIGVLNAESRRLRAFSEEDERLALTLAAQAAVAFQTANLYKKTQSALEQRVEDIKALERIYGLIGTASIEEVLKEICDEAANLTPAKYTGIWLLDEQARELRFGASNETAEPAQELPRLPLDGSSINAHVAETGSYYLIDDVSDDPHYAKWYGDVRSELTFPLKLGDRTIGTLNLESPELAAFDDDHVRLVEALAGAAAVAIQSVRHYERQEALARVGRIATSTLELDEVLERILHESREILGANYGTLRLFDRAEGNLELRAHEGPMAELTPEPIPLGQGVVGWVAEQGESLLVSETNIDGRYLPTVQGTLSELAVPIKIEDRVLGVLNVEHPEPHAFDEHDQQILEAIASHAATAIHNAKLYQARQTVNQVGQRLTGGIRMKEDQVLDLIHAQASELMDTDNMYIALYDETTDVVRFGLAYVRGERVDVEKEEGWGPRRGGHGRTEWIIRNRKPILITTKEKGEDWYEKPGHKEYVGKTLASWIGVPMIVGQRVIGVIATYHPDRDHVYSKDDLEILRAMADQAAIALDNSDLYYNVNRKWKALAGFQREITSGIRMREEEILELIHDQASELMDTDNMYIALYDEDSDVVRFGLAFFEGSRVDVEAEEGWQPRSGGTGRTEWIIRNQEPVLVSTQEEAREWYRKPGRQEYTGKGIWPSWLGVPMILGDEVLGVIATYHPEREYRYTGHDLEILQTMADQAAVAFTNARLLQQERRRANELDTLYDVSKKVGSTLDVKETLSLILRGAMELTGTDSGVVHLLGRNGGFERSYSYPPEFIHPEPRLRKGTMTHTILETGKPLVVPDTRNSPYVRREMVNSGVQSIVGVPLTLRDAVIGVFYLNANAPKVFTEEEQDLLGALADQAAIAIENARLYQEARDEVQATRQLSTLGTAIAALQHRINNTFNIIVPNMTRLRKRVDTSDPTIEEILDIVERNARYTSEIIERIQEPLGEVEFQDVDINSVLTDVAGRIEEDEGSSIDVQLVLDDSIPLFSAPIGQITEIFQNLADNACRIMDDGGELRITSSLVDEGIEVRVEDTGPGISPKIQERLFVKPVPSKEPGGGSGLGLWLSGLMLKSFGGKIGVEETSPAGTTMLVTIPIAGAGRGDSQ